MFLRQREIYFKYEIMSENNDNIINWLEFYIASGVDETFGDVPFVAESKPKEKVIEQPKVRPATSELALSSVDAVKSADNVCQNVTTIEELQKVVENFEGCSLKYNAKHTVIGDGNPKAKIMFIGEAPGAEEDLIGKAFVGRSGQLLNKMLEAIGLDRTKCYICNILPWRPPGNRSPSDAEIAVCLPFLKKQIEIVNPDYIFMLGAVAVNSLMGNAEGISKLRGKWMEYQNPNGKIIKVLAGYHPAYLLRTPAQKAKAWADFLRLKKDMAENN